MVGTSKTTMSRMSFNTTVVEENAPRFEHRDELMKLAAKMKQNIATGDRRKHFFKKYPDCFTGSEAVDWMLEQMEAKSVAEAVRKGQGLMTARYIEKVDKEVKFEYNRKRFYRFTPTTPELVHAPENPMPNPSLDIPLSASARRRALAALIGAFVAEAASTSLNGVSRPEKTIPNLLRPDFDPAFCGATESGAFGFFARSAPQMESSTGFEARVILQAIASRGHINGAVLAKDAYWGFKNNRRMLSSLSRAFIKRIQAGKNYPHCAVKCRSIDILSIVPIIVALYAGTDVLFSKVDEVVKVFYVGSRVRDAALVSAYILEQVILGASVLQAMRMGIRTERLTVKQRKVIFKAFTKSELPSYEAIQRFGNKGSLPTGFCAVLQPLFVLNDYMTAVRENIIGGGRSCRRAMFIGACFGAQDGLDAIPEDWVKKTPYFDFIEADSSALISRRDLKGNFFGEPSIGGNTSVGSQSMGERPYGDRMRVVENDYGRPSQEPEYERPSLNRVDSTPYVDYTPDTVLTASLLRASQRMYGDYGRNESESMESNDLATPRSVASNYSYCSRTTNGSSVGSLADLGDFSRLYSASSYSTRNKTPRTQLGSDMVHFYKRAYGSERYSSGNRSAYRSTMSTMRSSSDSNMFVFTGRGGGAASRASDTNVFFQSGGSMVSRLGSTGYGSNRGFSSSMSRLSDVRPRRSFNMHHQDQPVLAVPVATDADEHEPMDVDPVEVGTPDVMLAPRLSLGVDGFDQRVSLHAIL